MNMLMGILIFAAALVGCTDKDTDKVDEPEKVQKTIDVSNLDTSVAPGDNFFAYVNGTWQKKTPIPPEQSRWGSFNILQEQNNENLRKIVENAGAQKGKKGTPTQQIGDFFASGMDTQTINKLGYSPIAGQVENILAISTFDEAMTQFYALYAETITPLFSFWAGQDDKNSSMVIAHLGQGGLGLGNRDYYTEDDERSENIRKKYVAHIARMFQLIGQENAKVRAHAIMDFETKLAKSSMTRVEQRDPFKTYNKTDIDQLKKMVPLIDWDRFFAALQIPVPREMNITSMTFFKDLTDHVRNTDLTALKDYFLWNLLAERANLLSEDFVQESFDFWGKTFQGKQKLDKRWKRVLKVVNGLLGEELGKLYVETYFPPSAKASMEKLIANVRAAFGRRIDHLDWMSDETKIKAQEKLSAIAVKVGYPDKWIDYSSVDISPDTYCQNVVNARKFAYARMLADIDKPYDKEKWHITPQTVNAYYSPNSNEIVFPAGILQPPFFTNGADDAINYGAIGVVIAHEITHGFDDQGRHFDKNGNLSEWWTKQDAEKFREKAKLYGQEFANYIYSELGDNVHINPDLTMGENIADLGGVSISLSAFEKLIKGKPVELIDGFTPLQRFFLSYAQVWRQNIRTEELARRLKDDVHSPGDARVNVVLSNIPQFYRAFHITDGKMFLPPEGRIVIW